MKLNKESRDELRKSVEVLLKNSPKNKKIQLPKETLDLLLFDTYTCNKEKDIKIKVPVWSGEFLQKLDLSQVDFENVAWNMPFIIGDEHFYSDDEDKIFDENFKEMLDNLQFSPVGADDKIDAIYYVSYANTNAKINLKKSFEAKYIYDDFFIYFSGCNFKNVDLSKSDFINLKKIYTFCCDFSNTRIRFPQGICLEGTSSNYSNNDFSYLEIDGTEIIVGGDDYSKFNLSNTGINIKLDIEKLKTAIEANEKNKYWLTMYYKECINDWWIGCNLNGKKIKNQKEKKQTLEEMKTKYAEFKDEEFSRILGSVAEQINSPGHKR